MPTQQRLTRISRFYNRIGAQGWHKSGYITLSVRSSALRCWITAQLPAKRVKILSVGCGTGELESHLSDLQYQVVGIDTSQQMLKRAHNRGIKSLVQADSQRLPFTDHSFDVVIFMECIGYLHMLTAFREARRVLKERGRLLLTTYSGDVLVHAHYTKFLLDEVTSSLSATQFRIERHQFLHTKRNSVTEVPSDNESTLLYISCTK
jgi:ubiquinone/menaquinone biosynthesis C-methylase UbiE